MKIFYKREALGVRSACCAFPKNHLRPDGVEHVARILVLLCFNLYKSLIQKRSRCCALQALRVFLLSYLFSFSILCADNPEPLSFTQFPQQNDEQFLAFAKEWEGREVSIRGFPYKSSYGQFILSAEPNLRSCCVGSSHKRSQQIIVNGEIEYPKSTSPITLQGYFHIELHEGPQGKILQYYYYLNNPKNVMEKSKQNYPLFSLALTFTVGLGILIVAIYRNRSFQRYIKKLT